MPDDTYLMLVDGKVTAVDLGPMMRRHRAAHIKHRADAIDEAAAAFTEECFDPETVWDASTLSDADLDSAGHIAVTLVKIENHGRE
jgi:hypothetical protein